MHCEPIAFDGILVALLRHLDVRKKQKRSRDAILVREMHLNVTHILFGLYIASLSASPDDMVCVGCLKIDFSRPENPLNFFD